MFYTSTKRYIKNFLIVSFIFLCISVISSYFLYNSYKQILYNYYNSIVSSIVLHHPELEEEVIDSLLHPISSVEAERILKRYGFNDIDGYEYMNSFAKLRHKMVFYTVCIHLIFISFLLFLYMRDKRKEHLRIEQIQDYFNRILKGDYSIDLREYKESDLSSLKNDIYKVTNLLKEKEKYSSHEKKHLASVLSDISHQLKTPLTSMYVINDILENDDIDYEKKKEMLSKNRSQLERIEWLVTSLLKLSRLDSGMVTLKQENVFVLSLIEKALSPLRIPIELKEQNVIIEGDKNICISVDEKWTIEALVNIIKNAYEHTPVRGTITISYTENPIYIEIKIKDTGEGISSRDLPHIFERFYHGDTNKESIGIGLNMAKSIIEKQNGYIKVESKRKVGTTFILQFYKNIL